MDRQKHILVVDDDDSLRKALRKILEKAGYHVTLARDGDEALHQFRKVDFDLVLTDYRMPGKNGFRLAEEISRAEPRHPPPAVIMMTAYGDMGTYLDAMKLGFQEYIQKPISRSKLLTILEGVLYGHPRHPS